MNHFRSRRRTLLRVAVAVTTIALSCLAFAQVFNKELEIWVHGLPKLMARTKDPADVLLTSLHTIVRDPEICCIEDSALIEAARVADPTSLKDVAAKLSGKHHLSDGRTATVTTEYLTPEEMNSGHLIKMFNDQHAALLQWDSHLYVVNGLAYVWIPSVSQDSLSATSAIRKFLLIDTRYSDARRKTEFNRDTDDLSKIQGLLFVDVKLQ